MWEASLPSRRRASHRRTAGRAVRPTACACCPDAPLDDAALDQFGFLDFARALAEIVDNESTDTPLTVAVSAPWGAGKTSVAAMVQQLLERPVAEREGDRGRFVCWLRAALATTVACDPPFGLTSPPAGAAPPGPASERPDVPL